MYLLKISIRHNKKYFLLTLLINGIALRSEPKKFSIRDECIFCFPDFVIIGLCNF